MSGGSLTQAERYWILVHAATRPATDLEDPRISAGATLFLMPRDAGCTAATWVNQLCLSPTHTRLRRILKELTYATAHRIDVPVITRRRLLGIVPGTQQLDRSHPAFRTATRDCLAWLSEAGREQAAVLRMLELADTLKPLARIDAASISRALTTHRGSPGWHSCDTVVELVENAGFMNATLTGTL